MGQESLEDDARTGRAVLTDENIALLEDLVLDDRRLKMKKIAEMSGLSDTTLGQTIREHLNMKSRPKSYDLLGL